jgi:3'(2'), 5'-bisphosphate nucleotidase
MKYKEINLDYLKDIILKVGQEVLKIYHSNNIQKFSKIDQSPLSNADIKSHDLLTQFLFSQFPNIPILS